MRLLMVAADPMEFSGILAQASEVRRAEIAVDWARSAKLGPHPLMLAANGAGARRAAAAVDAALERFDAEGVLSTGFCGALVSELQIADIVVASEVVPASEVLVGSEVAVGGEVSAGAQGSPAARSFPALNPLSGNPHHTGVVWCLDHVAQTSEEKGRLRRQGGTVVEMEAAGVAERAGSKGLRFYCIKVVTDLAGEDMAIDFNGALRPDGHFGTIGILRYTSRDPLVRLPELIRLRNRCVRAARVLGDFIADCRF